MSIIGYKQRSKTNLSKNYQPCYVDKNLRLNSSIKDELGRKRKSKMMKDLGKCFFISQLKIHRIIQKSRNFMRKQKSLKKKIKNYRNKLKSIKIIMITYSMYLKIVSNVLRSLERKQSSAGKTSNTCEMNQTSRRNQKIRDSTIKNKDTIKTSKKSKIRQTR